MLVAVLFEALVKDEMIQNAPLTNTFTIGPVVDTEFKRIRLGRVSCHVAVLTMHCAEHASCFRAGSKEETREAV